MNEPKWSWTKLPLLRNAAALLQFRELVAIPIWFKWETWCPLIWREKPWSLSMFVRHGPDVFSGLPLFEIGNVPEKLVEYMLTFFPKTYFNFEINKSTQRPTDYCNLPRYMCICAFKCIHIQLFACLSCHAAMLHPWTWGDSRLYSGGLFLQRPLMDSKGQRVVDTHSKGQLQWISKWDHGGSWWMIVDYDVPLWDWCFLDLYIELGAVR